MTRLEHATHAPVADQPDETGSSVDQVSFLGTHGLGRHFTGPPVNRRKFVEALAPGAGPWQLYGSMTSSTILGSGHYLPSRVVTNDDLAKQFPTSDEWIQQRSGIRERRYIEHAGIGASDLALPAAKMALEQAGKTERDIDAIIFATLSPDYNFPGSGVLLQRKLGLAPIPALDVRNQCSGFLTRSPSQTHGSGAACTVTFSWRCRGALHRSEFSERGREVTVLFGDGAGAVVMGPLETSATKSAGYSRSCCTATASAPRSCGSRHDLVANRRVSHTR